MQQAGAADFSENKPVSTASSPEEAIPAQDNKPPTSAAKILSNRRNALKSTGPKTPQGKANSRRNAMKRGFLAGEILLSSPDRKNNDYTTLLTQLQKHFKPADIVEDLLVQTIAICYWRKKLAIRAEIGESSKQQAMAARGSSKSSQGDIVSLWLRMLYDCDRRRTTGRNNYTLTETEQQIVEQVRENRFGVKLVHIYLGHVREACIESNAVSEDARALLVVCCGREAEHLLSAFSRTTLSPSEQIKDFVERLDLEMAVLLRQKESLDELHNLHEQRLSVPDERADLL